MSNPEDRLVHLFRNEVLPQKECRFVSFSLGNNNNTPWLLFWNPTNAEARKKQFWEIHWEALIKKQMDEDLLLKASSQSEFWEQLKGLMDKETRKAMTVQIAE